MIFKKDTRTRPCSKAFMKIGVLIFAALVLQSCIYIRLLKTKKQLAEFDQYIELQQSDRGLAFVFTEPHLTADNLNRLGIYPVEVSPFDKGEIWKTGFAKTTIDGKHTPADDLWLYLTIEEDYLSEITIPSKYVHAFSAPVLADIARSFGDSKVSGVKKIISIEWSREKAGVGFINGEVIKSVLGAPHDLVYEESKTVFTYRYKKPAIREDEEASKVYTINIIFRKGEVLSLLESRAIRIDFTKG